MVDLQSCQHYIVFLASVQNKKATRISSKLINEGILLRDTHGAYGVSQRKVDSSYLEINQNLFINFLGL